MHRSQVAVGFLLGVVLAGCRGSVPTTGPTPAPTQPKVALTAPDKGEKPKEYPGLHNVVRVSDKLLSGSSPEGDEGFASLQGLGVRTIISVDGARPDVERARKHGQRYVHLPISYAGVPREQALRIARAVRDLPGLVYIHCHHGKHRSPAAAVAVVRCLDGACTVDQATAVLKQAGTSPHYKGLHAAVNEFQALTPAELDKVPADFPEVAPISDLVQSMVEVEEHWDLLKVVRAADWKVPAKHADLDPLHQARLLREAYEAAAKAPSVQQQAELKAWFVDAAKNVQELEKLLQSAKGSEPVDRKAAEAAFQRAGADCTRCHAKYRDAPK